MKLIVHQQITIKPETNAETIFLLNWQNSRIFTSFKTIDLEFLIYLSNYHLATAKLGSIRKTVNCK